MDQEVLASLATELELLRMSASEIAARIRTFGDVEVVVDDDQLEALEGIIVTREEPFSNWVSKL